MNKRIDEQLKTLSDNKVHNLDPNATWVRENRALLMSQIRNTVTVTEDQPQKRVADIPSLISFFSPKMFGRVMQPAVSALLVVLITVSGWMSTVSASPDKKIRWNVKIAGEKTQIVFAQATGSKKLEAELNLKHAAKRAQEIKVLLEKPEEKTAALVAKTSEKLKASIASANDTVEQIGEKSVEDAIELVKDFNAVTEEIQTTLDETVETAEEAQKATEEKIEEPTVQEEALEEALKEVAVIEDVVEEAGLDAVNTVVAIGTEAQEPLAEEVVEDIKEIVEEKIDNLLEDITSETMVEPEIVVQSTSTEHIAQIVETTTTEEVAVSTTTATPEVQEPVEPLVEREVVEEASEAIKELVGVDQLVEAIEKVRELKDVVEEPREEITPAEEVETAREEIREKIEEITTDTKELIATPVSEREVEDTTSEEVVDTDTPAVIETSVVEERSEEQAEPTRE